MFRRLMALIVCCLTSHLAVATMVIDNFQPAKHDRFAMGGSSFVGNGLDFSGVGRVENTSTTHSAWATMISSTHFLSASHFHPGTDNKVFFYPGNDPTATPVEMTVAGGCSVTDDFLVDGITETLNTDIWVGEFTQAVPSGIAIYSIAGAVIGNHLNSMVFHVGDSVNNQYSGGKRTTDFAIGKNVLDYSIAVGIEVSGFTTAATKLYADDRADGSIPMGTQGANFDPDGETRLVAGDSGGPTFINNGGTRPR